MVSTHLSADRAPRGAGLPCWQLLAEVLSSDGLDLDSELGVYMALAKWILADRQRRLPSFHGLFGAQLPLSLLLRDVAQMLHNTHSTLLSPHFKMSRVWRACLCTTAPFMTDIGSSARLLR